MATITTIGRWIHLPAAGGSDDRLRADQPGGSGTLQVAASNAELAARENGLRTVWEDPGSANVFRDLVVSGDPSTLDLHAEDADGAYVRLAGRHRVRFYGSTGQVPRLHLAARGFAPSAHTLGLLLALVPDEGETTLRTGLYGTATTTSTTLVDLAVTLDLTPEMLGRDTVACRGASAVEESGTATWVSCLVAAWCTSGSGLAKGALYGLTLSVREPS